MVAVAGCAHAARPAAAASCGEGWAPLTITHAPVAASEPFELPPAALITGVRIEGVPAALAATLASVIKTHAGQRFDEAPFKEDLRSLWAIGVVSDVRLETRGLDVAFVLTERPRVGTVVLRAEDRSLLRRFALLPGAPFEPQRLERMATAIEAGLVRDGHLDAKVEVVQAPSTAGPAPEWSKAGLPRPAMIDVCVASTPGPRVTIESVSFPGRQGVPEKVLLAAMKASKGGLNRAGGLYDEDSFSMDELYVSAEYWDRGYANVKVGEPRLVRHGPKLVIELPIQEGPKFHLGAIVIAAPGVDGVTLPIRPGDLFSRSKIADAREQLAKALGVDVLPLTKVDLDHERINLTFEPRWRWPWDAFAFWVSHSASR